MAELEFCVSFLREVLSHCSLVVWADVKQATGFFTKLSSLEESITGKVDHTMSRH